jgi:hypothetical protein
MSKRNEVVMANNDGDQIIVLEEANEAYITLNGLWTRLKELEGRTFEKEQGDRGVWRDCR